VPSGAVHLRIEAVSLLCWGGIGVYLLANGTISYPSFAAFVGSYLFSMLFLSPDLDLSQSRAFRRWGIFRWLWIPYARLFRHRGLSHRLILGPLSRVLYLTAIAWAFWFLLSLLGLRISPAAPPWRVLLAIGFGLYLPNLTHILADRIASLR
jgi:uncharacterized metal-binding protein